MEGLKQVRDWIQPGAWFCGMDLKDAYLHIPVCDAFRKFLRFKWMDMLLEWCVIPFGLKCSPRFETCHGVHKSYLGYFDIHLHG